MPHPGVWRWMSTPEKPFADTRLIIAEAYSALQARSKLHPPRFPGISFASIVQDKALSNNAGFAVNFMEGHDLGFGRLCQ